jgi:hypothetical protein
MYAQIFIEIYASRGAKQTHCLKKKIIKLLRIKSQRSFGQILKHC